MKNTIHNFDPKMKYQKYSHYLLPIAINPLDYGKLIENLDNKYIIQLNTSNVLVIKVSDNENFIRFFRRGDLMIEFTDKKISDIKFTRTILDQRFTFEKNKLISTEILSTAGSITIFNSNNTPLYEDTNAITLKKNIIKFLENTEIYKNKQAELFILFELFLIFLVYIIFFVIFPETNENIALAAFSAKNIIKLRKTSPNYK
jgi:hypothetical protein